MKLRWQDPEYRRRQSEISRENGKLVRGYSRREIRLGLVGRKSRASGVSRKDFIALLMVAILPLIFVAYEMGGLELPGWHTVSYFAAHNEALAVTVALMFPIAGIVGIAWWLHHLQSSIPK